MLETCVLAMSFAHNVKAFSGHIYISINIGEVQPYTGTEALYRLYGP
jgi:hypothetical protein